MTVTAPRQSEAGASPARSTAGRNPAVRRYLAAARTPRGAIGLALVVIMCTAAVATPLLFPGGYDLQGREALAPPSWGNPFGTDEFGRSVFVRSVYGLRTDLSLIAVAVPVAAVAGTLLGLLGAVNGAVGRLMQRCFDVIMGFPSLILGISVALVLGPGWTALAVAITIYSLPAFGRLARATMLTQLNRDYILAARMLGVGKSTIMLRHIVPHSLDTAITQSVVAVVAAVFLESSLSIVGLGVQPPTPSLGVLLNSGVRYMEHQSMYVVGPAVMLLLLVLGFSLLADALTRSGARR